MPQDFKPSDAVLIKATVLRMRGGLVEMQLGDGQMVRTTHTGIELQANTNVAKAVERAPENKAITRPAENKSDGIGGGGKGVKRK